jgi:hypothetical protein
MTDNYLGNIPQKTKGGSNWNPTKMKATYKAGVPNG